MRFFKFAIIFAATCLLTTIARAANIQQLPGYSAMSVSAAFEGFLDKNKAIASQLAATPELSRLVLSRPALQQQLIDGKTTLAAIRKQYLPEAAAKPATTANNAQALALLNRATKAAQSQAAQDRAETDIANTLALLENDDTVIIDDEALAALKDPNKPAIDITKEDSRRALEEAIARKPENNNKPVMGKPAIDKPVYDHTKPAEVDDPGNGNNNDNSSSGGGEPVQVSVVPDSYDINAVPANSSAVDANGWPAYLKVPAGCGAKPAGKTYEHAHLGYMRALYSHGVPGSGIPQGQTGSSGFGPGTGEYPGKIFQSLWRRGQTYLEVAGDGSMEYAVPFHANNHIGEAQLKHLLGYIDGYMAAGTLEYSVSYCPGDFNNTVLDGQPSLGDRCVQQSSMGIYVTDSTPRTDTTPRCYVEPGKRYFLNIRANPEHCLNQYAKCADVMSSQGSLHSFYTTPPYAGPCLDSGPYPENYNNRFCGERTTFTMAQSCREEGTDYYWSCYDTSDILPPQTYARTCNPEGTASVWTEGYRKAASNRYVCEHKSVSRSMGNTYVKDYSTLEFEGDYLTDNDRLVCAAHREGQFTGTQLHNGGKLVMQCQFNKNRKRYDWVAVEHSDGDPRIVNPQAPRPVIRTLARAPEHNGCMVNGTAYPMGAKRITKQTIPAGITETIEVCRLDGEKRNSDIEPLAAFHHEQGPPSTILLRHVSTVSYVNP